MKLLKRNILFWLLSFYRIFRDTRILLRKHEQEKEALRKQKMEKDAKLPFEKKKTLVKITDT
jgi:hypothetical protein